MAITYVHLSLVLDIYMGVIISLLKKKLHKEVLHARKYIPTEFF